MSHLFVDPLSLIRLVYMSMHVLWAYLPEHVQFISSFSITEVMTLLFPIRH